MVVVVAVYPQNTLDHRGAVESDEEVLVVVLCCYTLVGDPNSVSCSTCKV